MTTTARSEPSTSLVSLAAAPAIWAMHFLLSYATVAIWCAKVEREFVGAWLAIGIYTLAALIAIATLGARAWQRHRADGVQFPDDRDTATGRHRFVAFATLLVAGLSVVAIVFEALALALVGRCR
jgi:hypothetical protein